MHGVANLAGRGPATTTTVEQANSPGPDSQQTKHASLLSQSTRWWVDAAGMEEQNARDDLINQQAAFET